MTKFKLFLVLLALCYGGYFAWKTFGPGGSGFSLPNKNNRTSSISEAPDASGRGHHDEEANPAKALPPMAQHHQDLQTVSGRIFTALKSGGASQEVNLKNIWNASQSDFKAGVISEQDARLLVDIIRQLNLMDQDRQLYQQRYRELAQIKDSSFDKGMSAEQKRGFAEKELNRQWQGLVKVNQEKLKPLFSALSE